MKIRREALKKIGDHAAAGYPHEVVGILAGDRKGARVVKVAALENERADSPRNRYRVSGMLLAKAERALEAEGLEIVGYYHSHPDHPPLPSEEDRVNALPNMVYLIQAVEEAGPGAARCWELTDDRESMNSIPFDIDT